MMIKVSAQDIRGIEEKIAKTCGLDVEDVPSLADDYWYIDENKELFTKAEDGTDEWLPIGFSLKPARYVVSPYDGYRSKIDILNDARFFATKREAMEYAKMCEDEEIQEFYRENPRYKRGLFGPEPIKFSELERSEVMDIRDKFKDDAQTTDWNVHTLEEFEQEYNVKFKESLLIIDKVYDSLTSDFYDEDGRLIDDKLRF